MSIDFVVAGLGNPGSQYRGTRHNLGFEVCDRLATSAPGGWSGKWQSEVSDLRLQGSRILLVKPQTFMNESGRAIGEVIRFYQLALDQLVVVHDELDLELGTLRLKRGGGHGGHNGLISTAAHSGGPGFLRVRLGIGKPEHRSGADWVLGKFAQGEQSAAQELVEDGAQAVEDIVLKGFEAAQKVWNTKRTKGNE